MLEVIILGKELPFMYYKKIDKDINNNTNMFSTMYNNDSRVNSLSNKNREVSKYDRFKIEQKIVDIFNSSNYIYKADVVIVTNEGKKKKRIVGKNGSSLITMDNEYIPIKDILDIYKE